jgi:hypothetical protein
MKLSILKILFVLGILILTIASCADPERLAGLETDGKVSSSSMENSEAISSSSAAEDVYSSSVEEQSSSSGEQSSSSLSVDEVSSSSVLSPTASSSSALSSSSEQISSSSVLPEPSSSSLSEEEIWSLERGEGWVTLNDNNGYWFSYDDSDQDGCATTNFPKLSEEEDVVGPVWFEQETITYTFVPGCAYQYPFAGFGFNLTDPTDPTDILLSYVGIKIYGKVVAMSGINCRVEIIDSDRISGYSFYASIQDISLSGTIIPWSAFSQDDWGTEVTIQDALDSVTDIRFKCSMIPPPTSEAMAQVTLNKLSLMR